MPYCVKCGHQLHDAAIFCPNCGERIKEATVKEGLIHKCPNCGEVVESFTTHCPACGLEFRDRHLGTIVEKFSSKINEFEQKKRKEKFNIFNKTSEFVGNSIFNEELNFIKTYPIPNTKEDILEFFILTVSNIEPSAYGFQGNERRRLESEAWKSKAEQTYEKALIALKNDNSFSWISNKYNTKLQEIKNEKKRKILCYVGLFSFVIVLNTLVLLLCK